MKESAEISIAIFLGLSVVAFAINPIHAFGGFLLAVWFMSKMPTRDDTQEEEKE